MTFVALLAASGMLLSSPDLGIAEGRCRSPETGPSFLVEVAGLRDRRGRLKLELYPAVDGDFLADDNLLLAHGKAFARVDLPVPPSGPVQICIRAPRPGSFALSLLHDRDGDHRFSLSSDGIGFSGNPRLGWHKPAAASVRVETGGRPERLLIRLNYRTGPFSVGPIGG